MHCTDIVSLSCWSSEVEYKDGTELLYKLTQSFQILHLGNSCKFLQKIKLEVQLTIEFGLALIEFISPSLKLADCVQDRDIASLSFFLHAYQSFKKLIKLEWQIRDLVILTSFNCLTLIFSASDNCL